MTYCPTPAEARPKDNVSLRSAGSFVLLLVVVVLWVLVVVLVLCVLVVVVLEVLDVVAPQAAPAAWRKAGLSQLESVFTPDAPVKVTEQP